jgi:hypothetical protein
MSPCENTPDNLTVEKIKKIEAAHAATTPSETLVLVTTEPDEEDDYLTVLNTKTGQEFKVNSQIELNDALCDFVIPLKTKTFAYATVELMCKSQIKLTHHQDIISTYARHEKGKCLTIPDGSEDQELRVQVISEVLDDVLKVTYVCDDLIIGKRINGGVNLTFYLRIRRLFERSFQVVT